MDPSINPAPPPDPTVSRVKGTLVDAHRERLLGEELRNDSDSIGGLGSTMLGDSDVVVIWAADPETPPVSRVKRPTPAMSRAVNPSEPSGSSTEIRSDTLLPLSAPDHKEITEPEKAEAIASDRDVETRMAKTEYNAGFLNSLKAEKGEEFRRVLSSDTKEHDAPQHRAPIEKAEEELERLGIVQKTAKLPRDIVDIAGMGSNRPFHKLDEEPKIRTMEELFDKHKFYLSLGSKTGDVAKLDAQQKFLVDLVKTATDRGIDIAWKTMDHDYDQPCIYTQNPAELGQLLSEMYASPDYPKAMWNDVDRMFQQEISGVSDKHMGMVQEPLNGFRTDSHSGRMGSLAKRLSGPEEITPETYAEAARQGGLRPEAPGLLSEEARVEYYARIESRRASARAIRERSIRT